ncbi:PH domain-containing protein [uncultured Bacteroides sp.]|uniref:PH domain-containing protein n=1 Tax=uncultured Bacteroides sp. TaxID=162156 RepID=UPI002AABAA56|nr:PH domain-containing protein [uncultured Bacteroides sp.]
MDRVFHARITWYQYLYVLFLSLAIVFFIWEKIALPALLLAVLLVVLIEKLIHTTYTITTDGTLLISLGRFVKKRRISFTDILSVEKKHSMKIGGFSITHFLLIRYSYSKYVAVLPVKEDEFIELLNKLIMNHRSNK